TMPPTEANGRGFFVGSDIFRDAVERLTQSRPMASSAAETCAFKPAAERAPRHSGPASCSKKSPSLQKSPGKPASVAVTADIATVLPDISIDRRPEHGQYEPPLDTPYDPQEESLPILTVAPSLSPPASRTQARSADRQ